MKEHKCFRCGKEFFAKVWKTPRKYCSKECQYKGMSERLIFKADAKLNGASCWHRRYYNGTIKE
jgi:hypothetical protein